MKLVLSRDWLEMGGMLLPAMSVCQRSGMAADILRRCRAVQKDNSRDAGAPSYAAQPLYVMGLQLLAGMGLFNRRAMAQERDGKFPSRLALNSHLIR